MTAGSAAGSGRPYRVVDVFTSVPLAGNGLAVVDMSDADGGGAPLDGATMQRVARAFNLSETTFVRRADDWSYDVRIFTPSAELPFAGHPTLGTAFTLGPGRWTQRSGPGGSVVTMVDVDGAGMVRFEQPDPVLTEVYPDEAAAACGLSLADVPKAFVGEVGGTRHLLLATRRPLGSLRFDRDRALVATRAVRATGLGVLRPAGDETISFRLVVPSENAAFEDPGTGSAAAAVAFVAARLFGTAADVVVEQGVEIGRRSSMLVHAEPGAVTVGGAVASFARGRLQI